MPSKMTNFPFFHGEAFLLFVLLTGIGCVSSMALAMNPKASKLHSQVKITKKGHAMEVKIEPKDGLAINQEGPWMLQIKPTDSKNFTEIVVGKNTIKAGEKGLRLTKDYIDFDLPGYRFSTSCKPNSCGYDYRFVAFVCTSDKKVCYRDVHKGTYTPE